MSPQQAQARTPRALSIAGSDSGGGAGIQADLKAFAACGVHGMSAITAITAQSTVGVDAVLAVPAEMILAQVRAVVGDIGVDAVKVGMLGSREAALAVAQALAELPAGTPIVVDPVMVAESGAALLDQDARQALIEHVIPRASVLTPNLPEARELVGRAEASSDDEALARQVLALGCGAVVLTGGHREAAIDLFLEGPGGPAGSGDGEVREIHGPRHPDGAAHGSGCTHSSILAAQLALGLAPLQAAQRAREMTGEAVRNGLRDIGRGAGPVDVLHLRARH